MMQGKNSKLLGSRRRTEVLITVALLEETYPAELARLLSAPLFSVQRIVDALETEGVLATRVIGKERRVALNPNYFAGKQLKELLLRLSEAEDEIRAAAYQLRRRPRRKGKPL